MDKAKESNRRAFCGAMKRKAPSFTAKFLVKQQLIQQPTLDYGCGHGLDADTYHWEGYDPRYRETDLTGKKYRTIICNNVLNVSTYQHRRSILERIQALLTPDGIAYLTVPRNIPKKGKFEPNKNLQYYVILNLPTVHVDHRREIYQLKKDDEIRDNTPEFNTVKGKLKQLSRRKRESLRSQV